MQVKILLLLSLASASLVDAFHIGEKPISVGALQKYTSTKPINIQYKDEQKRIDKQALHNTSVVENQPPSFIGPVCIKRLSANTLNNCKDVSLSNEIPSLLQILEKHSIISFNEYKSLMRYPQGLLSLFSDLNVSADVDGGVALIRALESGSVYACSRLTENLYPKLAAYNHYVTFIKEALNLTLVSEDDRALLWRYRSSLIEQFGTKIEQLMRLSATDTALFHLEGVPVLHQENKIKLLNEICGQARSKYSIQIQMQRAAYGE